MQDTRFFLLLLDLALEISREALDLLESREVSLANYCSQRTCLWVTMIAISDLSLDQYPSRSNDEHRRY